MTKINVDTDELIKCGKELNNKLYNYNNQIVLLSKIMEESKQYWDGVDAQQFFAIVTEKNKELRQCGEMYLCYSKYICDVAKKIENVAEMTKLV